LSVVPRRFRGAAYCLRNRPPSQARDRDGPQQGRRAAGPWIRGPHASPVYYRAPMSTLLFSRLRKTYAATVAVDDVTFEVRPREVFGLLGPNGAGKTTLIRMLIDIIAPDSGDILLDGRPLGRADRDRIGYLVEELCDRVAMIDHGRLVLYGVLEEIRRRHGESIVLVGADADLEELPVVARVEPQGALHRVILRDGARPRDLMALLLEKRIAIDHFEALRMPVEDIFVRTVRSRSATPAPPPPPVVAGAERRA